MSMIITKVGRRGQITLPKKIRHQIGLQEGDSIVMFAQNDTVVLRPITKNLLDLRGSVPVSEAQDFSAIRQQVLHDYARRIAQDED
jgi:AbrB family looped-hinge helix DNA binding protein